MAVTKYSYTKSANVPRLQSEIGASAIVTALELIEISGTALDISFKDAISAGDKTILDQLVTDHVNTPLDNPDEVRGPDGELIVRPMAAKPGRVYHQHYIQLETSVQASLVEKNQNNMVIGYSAISFFKYTLDMNDEPTNVLESCMESMAEVTQVDFSPPYDYEIIGGEIRVLDKPIQDTHLYVIAVPDLAAPLGNKSMVQNCNLKFYGHGDPIIADGKVVKDMVYQTAGVPDGWTNKIRFYIKHHRGSKLELQCKIEMFKA